MYVKRSRQQDIWCISTWYLSERLYPVLYCILYFEPWDIWCQTFLVIGISKANIAQRNGSLKRRLHILHPWWLAMQSYRVYPKKYAHGFVVLCFVVVVQSFIMNSHEVFIHIHQGCFAGTGAIVRLPQCQWSKPVGYGKISQCITTTKHSKAKPVCIFLGIYCMHNSIFSVSPELFHWH